jgi:hypothetical protein
MITTLVICVEWCLTWYPTKNRYRRYPCPASSIFDTWLSYLHSRTYVFVFVFIFVFEFKSE